MPTVCSHLLVPGRKQALGAAPFFFLGSFLPWHCPCARRSPEPSFHSLPCSSGRSWIRNMTMSNEPKLDSSLKSGFSTKAAKVALLGLTQPVERELPECASNAVEIGPLEWKGDVLAVGILEGSISKDGNGPFGILDPSLLDLLREVAEEEDFTGKTGQSTFIRLTGFGFKRLGLIGLGKPESIKSTKVWKGLGEAVAIAAKTAQAASVAIVCTAAADLSDNEKLDVASAVTAGVILGSYEDARFKSEAKKSNIKSIDILGLGPKHFFEDKLKKTLKVLDGVIACRKLVNSPANVLTPSALAEEAEEIASAYSNVITAKILEEEACRELKMGSYLGVAAASANPPKFIHLQYRPSGDVKVKLAIVGKGLTFDSGGYNLKTGQGSSIELMKFDMGGAAAALGAAKAIGAISPPGVEVNFIVAACENMISGTGMRPGDILTASNGKTIEVNNTDAEGRLTLADALVYACKLEVDKIVDLATLTGACVVALGNEVGGMFTPNDELAEELSECSRKVGEKLWRLPLEDAYWEMMKSGIADMVNTGGRAGGSITAALFLRQFVDEKIPWAHLDIAGPVWSEKKRGATGFAVATLVEWVLKHSAS